MRRGALRSRQDQLKAMLAASSAAGATNTQQPAATGSRRRSFELLPRQRLPVLFSQLPAKEEAFAAVLLATRVPRRRFVMPDILPDVIQRAPDRGA